MKTTQRFKCPRCGGKYFGTILDTAATDFQILGYTCGSFSDGNGYGSIFDENAPPKGLQLCGWQGKAEECVTDIQAEPAIATAEKGDVQEGSVT